MKANVGGIDRIVRITAGLVLIGLAATGTVGLWGWLGVVPLATSTGAGAEMRRAIGVAVFSGTQDEFVVRQARALGAGGYVGKGAHIDDIQIVFVYVRESAARGAERDFAPIASVVGQVSDRGVCDAIEKRFFLVPNQD